MPRGIARFHDMAGSHRVLRSRRREPYTDPGLSHADVNPEPTSLSHADVNPEPTSLSHADVNPKPIGLSHAYAAKRLEADCETAKRMRLGVRWMLGDAC
jgi:hypothetical protein